MMRVHVVAVRNLSSVTVSNGKRKKDAACVHWLWKSCH
jgi:hypothetical protein